MRKPSGPSASRSPSGSARAAPRCPGPRQAGGRALVATWAPRDRTVPATRRTRRSADAPQVEIAAEDQRVTARERAGMLSGLHHLGMALAGARHGQVHTGDRRCGAPAGRPPAPAAGCGARAGSPARIAPCPRPATGRARGSCSTRPRSIRSGPGWTRAIAARTGGRKLREVRDSAPLAPAAAAERLEPARRSLLEQGDAPVAGAQNLRELQEQRSVDLRVGRAHLGEPKQARAAGQKHRIRRVVAPVEQVPREHGDERALRGATRRRIRGWLATFSPERSLRARS